MLMCVPNPSPWVTALLTVVRSLPQPLDEKLAGIKHRLYSDNYLHLTDEIDHVEAPFPTNADRCMAIELQKRLDPAIYSLVCPPARRRFPRFLLVAAQDSSSNSSLQAGTTSRPPSWQIWPTRSVMSV